MAGLLDGEGSVSTLRTVDKRTGRVARGFRINISAVSNSNPLILAKAEQILLSWEIYFVKRQTHPQFWTLEIKGSMENKRKFLSIVYSAVAGKQEQVRLLIQFMDQRLSAAKKHPLNESECYLLEQVRALNHLNYLGTVTTAREPRESVMIQSELGSDVESAAEMTAPTLKLA